MARPLSIAIIGAGMGGLATAAALRRVGINVTVYEQATQFARIGAGIQIGCNAMKVLRGLGLEARLRAQSFYPRSWNNRDWRTGEVKFDMIFGESAEQKFGAPYLLAHRGDLHAALASAVPDECVRLDHKLVGLDETGEGVRLTFANGASETADAVVGADGIHSLVRDILFGTSPVSFTGRIAYRTTYPAALLGGEKIDDCTKWWGEDRHIVIYYVKPDRSEIYPSPASRSRISASSRGRRRATSGNCARRSPASTARSSRCWPRAPMSTNGRSSIAIHWSDGRIAT
jgi:salicylate hydroxylase/6-hydroxynicotinate 3-monooxygenase